MKSYWFLRALSLCAFVIAKVSSAAVDGSDAPFPPETYVFSLWNINSTNSSGNDSAIINSTLTKLEAIGNDTSLSDCQKCTERLSLGKNISLSRPDLVPIIWTKWCTVTGVDTAIDCEVTYSRNTVQRTGYGTDFTNVLQLMDPSSYDGQYYCYYQEDVCSLPATPEVDISYMWPQKQPKHYIAPTPGSETFNVLHVSDFHIELDYTIGGEGNCSSGGICCTPHCYREKPFPSGYNETYYNTSTQSFYNSSYVNGEFVKGDFEYYYNSSIYQPAHTFGEYECDAPEVLINNSLKSITDYQKLKNLNFQFAIFTGDLVDHDEDQYISFESTVLSEEYIYRDLKYRLQNISVFPVLGNHDSYPYGQLAQNSSGHSNLYNWNYDLMAEMWSDFGWLDASAAQQVRSHYTGYAITTQQGLKIISLNSNSWYDANLYTFWNSTEPDTFGQFEFLVDELVASEAIDQRVWIIAHIPPIVSDILPIPAKLFSDVIKRFSPYTIAGIFYGHTHEDQFSILYAGNGTEKTAENVVNHAWITQAVTPQVQKNPSWRYYEVDSKTFSIMDSQNFYFKLNETFDNSGNEPTWEFEYSARDAFDIDWPSTSPLNASYWHLVAEKMKNSTYYNQMYTNYEYRFSPYTPDCSSTTDCKDNWCYVTSFTYERYANCTS